MPEIPQGQQLFSDPSEVRPVIFGQSRIYNRGRKASASTKAIKTMEAGQSVRISHPDVACTVGLALPRQGCTLTMTVWNLQKKYPDRKYEYYHEANQVLVIRRIM